MPAMRGRRRVLNARTGGFLGIEKKFIDYTYGPTAIVTTNTSAEADPGSSVDCISAVAQGDGESNRDGRKMVIKNIHLRGNVEFAAIDDAGSIAGPAIVRVAVIWDTQTNAGQENSEDVFLAATNVEHAYRNLQFSKRFRVLMDRSFTLNLTAAAAGTAITVDSGGVARTFTMDKTVNIPVEHKATTAVVGSVVDNSIHVIAFASRSGVNLSYQSRVRFVG